MECVILFRNTSNGHVGFVWDKEVDEIAVFADHAAAAQAALTTPILKAYPYEIIELGI